jgi:hypothetical protein
LEISVFRARKSRDQPARLQAKKSIAQQRVMASGGEGLLIEAEATAEKSQN